MGNYRFHSLYIGVKSFAGEELPQNDLFFSVFKGIDELKSLLFQAKPPSTWIMALPKFAYLPAMWIMPLHKKAYLPATWIGALPKGANPPSKWIMLLHKKAYPPITWMEALSEKAGHKTEKFIKKSIKLTH